MRIQSYKRACIDVFGNVEPYAYEPFARDSSECGESDDKEDTDAEERLNNTD